MPSRWMAPKLAKMRRPYTDEQLMWLDDRVYIDPEVLDRMADEKFWAGWDKNLARTGLCEKCRQVRTSAGGCGCDMYVPAQPRTLAQRQEARRARVAVDMVRQHQPKRTVQAAPQSARARRKAVRQIAQAAQARRLSEMRQR